MQGSKSIPIKQKPGTKATAKVRTPRASNLVKPDAANPIPFEHSGSSAFSIVNQTFYLPFLNPNDNFAQLLLESRLLSATNNACISTKKDYCAGDGFMDSEKKQDISDDIKEWFRSMNIKGEHVTDINCKIFEDFFTWGNVPIELVRMTVGKEKKFFVYVHNFLEWRLEKADDDDIVQRAIQSKLFMRDRRGYLTQEQIAKSKKLPIYSSQKQDSDNWFQDENGTERTLIWYKNPVSGFDHYGLPSNVASMIYQILEYKGARYNLDNFENNMIVAAILALKGNLSQQEADKIARKIMNQHIGDGKRGRTVVVASEEGQGIEGSSFHKLDTTQDGSYIQADDKWTQKIILANQWDAILAGIVSPSTQGKGSGFITKLEEQKLKTVIRPAQQHLVDKVWRHIFREADAWMNLGLDKYHLVFKNTIDISGLTDVDITPAVQVNEVRSAKGLQPDPKMEGVYMKAAAPETNTPKPEGGTDV